MAKRKWPRRILKPQKPTRDQVLFVAAIIIAFVLIDIFFAITTAAIVMEMIMVVLLALQSKAILKLLNAGRN